METYVTVCGMRIRVTCDRETAFAHVAMNDGVVEPFTADELRAIAAELDKLDEIAAIEAEGA